MGFTDLTSESQPIALNFLNLELAEQRVGAIAPTHIQPLNLCHKLKTIRYPNPELKQLTVKLNGGR